MKNSKEFDVIVVGAGHAGCEAALASAGSGLKTLLFTITLETIAALPCNPSIGGQGKGQLVREIDALGGEMAVVADETSIQRRRLNTRKGIAVQANRFQSDKEAYSRRMMKSLFAKPNLYVLQAMVTDLHFENGNIAGVKIISGETWFAPVVVITAGTFLRGKIHIGTTNFSSGRAGEPAADHLGESLVKLGLPIARFKTGTPPRVNVSSINFTGLERQDNDDETAPFSLWSEPSLFETRPCYITHTNKETHRIIKENFGRSAMMSGIIKGTGVRYCPSIEDKLSKFPDKDCHKVFLEPEGYYSNEIYLQGLSTSLPEDVQEAYVQTIMGLENAQITRPGYAIEYDIVDPIDLHPTLMSKSIKNLFLAGQINGTSGYEEAAAQGLVAGINAAAVVKGKPPLLLDAETSYTGLLIRDITTLGISEPYRVFTSRSPFRLNLRMTNAEARLSEIGFEKGVLSLQKAEKIRQRENCMSTIEKKLESYTLTPNKLEEVFPEFAVPKPSSSVSLAQILKRSDVELKQFVNQIPEINDLDKLAVLEVEARIKYAGYLVQQQKEFDLQESMKEISLDDNFFDNLPVAVSHEAKIKILGVRPKTVGELANIPGVRASDLALIIMSVKKQHHKSARAGSIS
ncbi:MAG: tRNA uridine-5-carboxymethylaminomethyl(34) synthesis enzyme MnmG [Candidatus Riflebacteria bacterium]|nr:tRNA uridine-5-carboxymethylaminomethyl(34) synthesis enzyme MnmG [Candidatus Riflebacteria bacterium]